MQINNFADFCDELIKSGFSMGGGNAKGIYAVIPFGWEDKDAPPDSPVRWHTGDAETDPWEWRMRVLEERDDIAYAKLFFRASGYIAKQWYPLFYAVRRRGISFDEAYADGGLSYAAKRIYDVVSENGEIAFNDIKQKGGFGRDEKHEFERAITELQMRMYITMCGRERRINSRGEGYGWNVTAFTTAEDFWKSRGAEIPKLDAEESFEAIKAQIKKLNPQAEEKLIKKFILG